DVDPAQRSRLTRYAQALGQGDPLVGREGEFPVHPSGLLAAIVLRDPTDRQIFCGARRQHEALELVDCVVVATTGGLVNPPLEPEHRPLDVFPVDGLPVIRWRRPAGRRRADNPNSAWWLYRPIGWADVGVCPALPGALASSAIPPNAGMRLTPAPPFDGEPALGYSVPHPRFPGPVGRCFPPGFVGVDPQSEGEPLSPAALSVLDPAVCCLASTNCSVRPVCLNDGSVAPSSSCPWI